MSRSQIGRALSVKTGQAKAITIFITEKMSMDVFLQQKDTLKEALKIIETQKKVKLDAGSYQFKTFDGMVISVATQVKSLTTNELYLSPPLNLIESK